MLRIFQFQLENSINVLFENESNALFNVSQAIKELKNNALWQNIEKIIEDLEKFISTGKREFRIINKLPCADLNFDSERQIR